jgi:hypothetical protein
MRPVIFCAFALAFAIPAAAADLPLLFEPNEGQSGPGVEFLSRGAGVTSRLGPAHAEFPIGSSIVRMDLMGGATVHGEGVDRLPGLSSYFTGRDPSQWRTHIPQFGQVRYRNVYRGIDLVYYGNHGALEYDFVIAPGAQPNDIRLVYRGIKRLRLVGDDLVLDADGGKIRQHRPTAYQVINGARSEIAASYSLSGDRQIGIKLGRYDKSLPLIVDPVLEYSTYVGGGVGQDGPTWETGVRTDSEGNVYLTGVIASAAGTPSGMANVVKFSPSRNQILYWVNYSTGTGPQHVVLPYSLAVDAQGSAYICGIAAQGMIPIVNAYQSTGHSGDVDGYVAKFAPDGQSLVYSTYLGGSLADWLYGIAVDATGNAFVTGSTTSGDFPVLNAVQPTRKSPANDVETVVAKFSPTGQLLFSTYFGGTGGSSGSAVAVDSSGSPVVTGNAFTGRNGHDFPTTPNAYQTTVPETECMFAAKFTTDGQLVFSTLFGGDFTTSGPVVLDSQNNLYLAGQAMRPTLPVVNALMPQWPGSYNAFVAKLSPDGTRLLHSTYLGGNGIDYLRALAVDGGGNIYAAGGTSSTNFPLKNSLTPFLVNPNIPAAWNSYGFVTKIGPDGQSLVYSTLIGGSQASTIISAMAVDSAGKVYVAGATSDADFPLQNAFQSTIGNVTGATSNYPSTVFLARLSDAPGEGPTIYTPPPPGPVLTVSPNTFTVNAVLDGMATSQAADITSSAAGTTFTAAASTNPVFINGAIATVNWLSVSPASGTAPAQITVTANPAGMPAGVYNGSVTVTPASGNPTGIGVTMVVSPFAATVSAAPSSLAFSSTKDGTAPPQAIALSATGSAAVSLSVSTASGGSWLAVTPNSATAPFQASVSVNTLGLAAGSYSGVVSAQPQGGTATSVPVTLSITAPAPVPSPVIASISPATLASGQKDQVVTVKGSGFLAKTAVSLVLANYEFPATLTPVTFVDSSTLTVTVRGLFLFQPGSLGIRLTNPGASVATTLTAAIQ